MSDDVEQSARLVSKRLEKLEVDLAIRMLTYAAFQSEMAANLKADEIINHLRVFFTDDVIEKAKGRLLGRN